MIDLRFTCRWVGLSKNPVRGDFFDLIFLVRFFIKKKMNAAERYYQTICKGGLTFERPPKQLLICEKQALLLKFEFNRTTMILNQFYGLIFAQWPCLNAIENLRYFWLFSVVIRGEAWRRQAAFEPLYVKSTMR